MNQIESIAEQNAEVFIRKHFSNLHENDKMVRVIKSSVRETIKQALLALHLEKIK